VQNLTTLNRIDVEKVGARIRAIAAEELLSKFRRVGALEIEEKAPGDLVTSADRAMETRLSTFLTWALPGSQVVGEEAVFCDPELLDLLQEDSPVWIVDPLDGTSNFVGGSENFSVIVALVQSGQTLAAWVHAPALEWMAIAVLGSGATLNGRVLKVASARPLELQRIVTTHPSYMSNDDRLLFSQIAETGITTIPSRGAGVEYVGLADGLTDAAIFTWEKPWDHAAGLLIHAEAGGLCEMLDGAQFALAGGNNLPMLIASSEDAVNALRALVLKGLSDDDN
jgi:fructose-1,6-bisphosphatase/inositol monophosphatase family enzyme